MEVERHAAKAWRQALANVDNQVAYGSFKRFYEKTPKPKSLPGVKVLVDEIISKAESQWIMNFGLDLIGVSQEDRESVMQRWTSAGQPPVGKFLPFFTHVFTVKMFFFLGMGADLIARERASHLVDMAYLYYLPFCDIFTSNDKLHISIAPLFMRTEQSFVSGTQLKADLAALNAHYSAFPEDVRNNGLMTFARYPPEDPCFLTTQLWDKHCSGWRAISKQKDTLSEETRSALVAMIKKFTEQSTPIPSSSIKSMADVGQLAISRQVRLRKGSWRRFTPKVEANSLKTEKLQ